MDLEKTDQPDVLRDKKSGALINTNSKKLSGYKLQKQKMREINNLKSGYDTLIKENKKLREDLEKIKLTLDEVIKKVK